jgi:hypothetical protein
MKSEKYTLEYQWGKAEIKGDVEIRTNAFNGDATQFHYLSVGGDDIARYVRRRKGKVWDEGKTILDHGMITIGKGNLLAGVLLTYWLKNERKQRRFSLKEFFPEIFPSESGSKSSSV